MTRTEEDALKFIGMLPKPVWAPEITWTGDGEVLLEWEGEGKCVLVSFEGNGCYGYSYTSRGGAGAGPFFKKIEEGLPEGFALMIDAGLKLGDLSAWK